MNNTGRLILACLASATAGVVIGMLIAPDNREKLKHNLATAAENLLSSLARPSELKEGRDSAKGSMVKNHG